jgi:hypothetical protein
MADCQNCAFSTSCLFPLTIQGLPTFARHTDTSSAYVAIQEYASEAQPREDGFAGRVRNAILAAADRFAAGAERANDMTVLVLMRRG